MLFHFEKNPSHTGFSLFKVLSTSNHRRHCGNGSYSTSGNSPYMFKYVLKPGTQQYVLILLITGYELPIFRMMSEKNGCCVNMVCCILLSCVCMNSRLHRRLGSSPRKPITCIKAECLVWSGVWLQPWPFAGCHSLLFLSLSSLQPSKYAKKHFFKKEFTVTINVH